MKQLWKRWLAAAMAGLMMCMIGGVMPGNVQMHLGEPIVAKASQVDDVLSVARSKIGWTNYSGYCLQFVQDVFQEAGINTERKPAARDARDAWQISTDRNIPAGAVVFFDNEFGVEYWDTSVNGPFGYYGHIEISAGGDKIIGSGGGTIQERSMNSYYWKHYTGWGWLGGIELTSVAPTPIGHVMSESDGAGQTIPDGDYYIYNALDCHYYMDLPARELESGDNVKMWNDENKLPGLHYAWTVTYRGNGFYKIKQKETNLCLDVEYGNLAKGTNVWIWKDDNSNEQQWSIERTETGYTITSRANAWCLDVEGYDGVTNGSNVHVWSDNGNPYQRWCFIPAEPKPIIEDGIYQIKSSKDTNYALSVGEVKDNFAKLELWDTAERSTYFKITHQEGGYYKLQELSSGSYLDLPDSDYMNVKNDFRINVDTDTRDKLYAFLPLYDGTYTIVSQYSGYAMDLLDGKVENGTTIRQFTYNSPTASPAERWILEKITPLDLVSGDVNANGTFNLVDLVLVQKWLHADPLTELTDPDAADANQDGLIDIFDLALLKRKLLKLQTPVVQDVPPEPTSTPDDEPPHPTDPGFEQW